MPVDNLMELATFVGGSLTAVAYFPQLVKIIKNKSSLGNSLIAWYLWLLGVVAILIYSFYIKDLVLIALHILYFICITVVIFLIYKYQHNENKNRNC